MEEIKKIFLVCGEPSGDLLAASLAAAIKQQAPQIKIAGVGGSSLSLACDELFYDIKGLSVMGLFDVFKKLPRFLNLKRIILNKIGSDRPNAIILVDFSGFNLRLAKAINKRIPVIYYVSPQVWASRAGRIKRIKQFISKMIVLFRFEEDFYKKHAIEALWAGHPLLDLVKPTCAKKEFIDKNGLSPLKQTVALLPGSRRQEIKYMLGLMLKSAKIINRQIPGTQFVIAKSSSLDLEIYQKESKTSTLELKIIEGKTADCLNAADASIVCSGTATLEAAIIGKPFVVVYKTNMFNYLLFRPQIKIPYIGMVNIVAGKKIVPEFIQFNASPKKIASAVIDLLTGSAQADLMKQNLQSLKSSLGQSGASIRAAKLILEFLQSR